MWDRIHQPTAHLVRLFLLAGATTVVFLLDTLWPFEVTVAVLYVVVVLYASRTMSSRVTFVVGAICSVLTLASFLVVHRDAYDATSVLRCFVSLCAIGTTALLAFDMQRAAAKARERATLLELTHDAIVVRDVKGGQDRINYWNSGATGLYGWTDEDAAGRDPRQLLKSKFSMTDQAIRRSLEARGHWTGEVTQTRRDGTSVVVESRWSLQRDGRGLPSAILEINSDVTRRKEAESALHRARTELAHAARVATLGELASSIVHEVRQPLTSAITDAGAGLRWLRRDVPNLAEVEASLERIAASARRANDVVSRVRALATKAPAQATEFSLNDVVADVLPLVERELTTHDVTLNLSLARGLPSVSGDRIQLQQVLLNLIMNGIQAMSAVERRPRTLSIRSWLRVDPGEVPSAAVEVCDTGVGLDAQTSSRVFEPFYTTKSDGLGMGLSICRSIAESHGGRITTLACAGVGAAFLLALPIADGADDPAPMDDHVPVASRETMGPATDRSRRAA